MRFVSVQINPFDAHKHGALPLVGDARAVLAQLGGALAGYRVSDECARDITAARAAWQQARAAILSPALSWR